MKKLLWLIAIAGIATLSSCMQGRGVGQISVAGQGRMEIEADEFYININLREYFVEELSPYNDASILSTLGPNILTLEDQLLAQLTALGVERDALRLQNAGSEFIWRNYNNTNTKSRTEVRNRSYQVMVNSMELADKILTLELPHGSKSSMYDMRNSQIEEFKLMTKRLALDNARVRADNLAQGYGKIVGLIFVSEDDSRITQQQGETGMMKASKSSNVLMRDSVSEGMAYREDEASERMAVATRKIIITASVDAVFAVQ